jgi:ATP-dependent Clp protease protease subunit
MKFVSEYPAVVRQTSGENGRSTSIRVFSKTASFHWHSIDDLANLVVAQSVSADGGCQKDINSISLAGWFYDPGLAVYDTMQFVTCDVNTYCMGIAASMGRFSSVPGRKASVMPCRTPTS